MAGVVFVEVGIVVIVGVMSASVERWWTVECVAGVA